MLSNLAEQLGLKTLEKETEQVTG
jgi:hypothetical protein